MQSHIKDKILELAKAHHSFFLYDLDVVRSQADKLRKLPLNVEIFYAMKANDDPRIIQATLCHTQISGIEIASQGEAEKVLKQTRDLSRVIYTGPSKRVEELEFVVENRIQLINVESLTEAYRIQNLAALPQDILLRVSTNKEIHGVKTKMASVDKPTSFGVEENEAISVVKRLKGLDRLKLRGLHMFGATGILDYRALLDYVDYCFNLTKKIEHAAESAFPILDFGGGPGVDYEGNSHFDMSFFGRGLDKLIKQNGMGDKRLIFELGRFISADCGYFVTTINDIKTSHGKKILVTTAGTHAHKRQQALNINYPIEILNRGENYLYADQLSALRERVQIRGPLCTPIDWLSLNCYVEKADIGDLVVMKKTGAYGADQSNKDHLSHEHAPEFTIG